MDQTQIQELNNLVREAREIAVLTSSVESRDALSAVLALGQSLEKNGKMITLAVPAKPQNIDGLLHSESLNTDLGGRNLVISINCPQDPIECINKVSYNTDNGKFNLVLEPKGPEKIRTEGINFSYQGLKADLIFLIAVAEPTKLLEIYQKNQEAFKNTPTVNIDNQSHNANYAKFNLVVSGASSVSEIVMQLINGLGLAVDDEIATNLYSGLVAATGNFQSEKTGAMAFEAAAFCLRNGAKRLTKTKTSPNNEVKKPDETEKSIPQDWLSQPAVYKGSPSV